MRINNFLIICRKCKEKSLCNLAWNPNQAFILSCFNCGEIEPISVKGVRFPKDKEEFIELVKLPKQTTTN